MITRIIILLILIHFNLFNGWFMALWIIDVCLKVIGDIISLLCKILDID